MSHPELIVRTLDSHLSKPTRLILYGRAALALGFHSSPPDFHATMDVDAILPEIEMTSIETDDAFWEAIEKTNAQLEPTGLYLTHLFTDSQVILRSNWLEHLTPIPLEGLKFLQLQRPCIEDLILTKMMRIDPQDRSDIRFLVSQLSTDTSLTPIFEAARIPNIPEIHEAFSQNRRWFESEPPT